MRAGDIIEEFAAKDGRKFILRVPTMNDLSTYLDFINELVREGAEIQLNKEQTYEQEKEYLKEKLEKIASGDEICVSAFFNDKLIGDAEIVRNPGRSSSTGTLGISIIEGYRGIELGTEMMRILLEKAKEAGYRMVILNVYADNLRAIHLYEKFGFVKAGTIPKYAYFEGKGFVDSITMYKFLQE